jgi:uncharacterized membrane protein (DUF4010 family)
MGSESFIGSMPSTDMQTAAAAAAAAAANLLIDSKVNLKEFISRLNLNEFISRVNLNEYVNLMLKFD